VLVPGVVNCSVVRTVSLVVEGSET